MPLQELERREEHRKEVEEIQKRIREKGLAIQITRPVGAYILRLLSIADTAFARHAGC